MTAQEIFDKIALHLLRQGKRSTKGPNQNCAYRGEGGLMCAVGVLIPDRAYKPYLDEDMLGAPDLFEIEGLRSYLLADDLGEGDSIRMLKDLQRLHDVSEPERWPMILLGLAYKYGLNTQAIADITSQQ